MIICGVEREGQRLNIGDWGSGVLFFDGDFVLILFVVLFKFSILFIAEFFWL